MKPTMAELSLMTGTEETKQDDSNSYQRLPSPLRKNITTVLLTKQELIISLK